MKAKFLILIIVTIFHSYYAGASTDEPFLEVDSRVEEIIRSRMSERPVGPFRVEHPRNKLFGDVVEKFNEATSRPTSKTLSILCGRALMAKMRLFKFHYLCEESDEGNRLYSHDSSTLSVIFDYIQTALHKDMNLKMVRSLKILDDRFDVRKLLQRLPSSVDEIDAFFNKIWPVMEDHGLLKIGDISKENVRGALKLLSQVRVDS